MIETFRGVVQPTHMDQMGHMNMQHYVGRFDESTWQLFAALGLGQSYFEETQTGMAALEQNIKYLSELRVGAPIHIRAGVREIGAKTIRFAHSMRRSESDAEFAQCEMLGVHFDLRTRKSVALPGFVRDIAADKAAAIMIGPAG